MAPSAELDLGFSLIPISGIVLLMRSVMEGTIGELWPYAFPVLLVTFFCCYLAIRWAVDQFCSEEVLFREGEKWDLGSWLIQSVRNRRSLPTAQLAVLCGVLILVVKFFLESTLDLPRTPSGIAAMSLAQFSWKAILLPMITILGITLAMTFLFTGRPQQTLGLVRPPSLSLVAAALMAICLYPVATMLQMLVSETYAIPQQMQAMLEAVEMKLASGPGWVALILLALVPAVCEELAFRGFILTGLRQPGSGHRKRRWRGDCGEQSVLCPGPRHPAATDQRVFSRSGTGLHRLPGAEHLAGHSLPSDAQHHCLPGACKRRVGVARHAAVVGRRVASRWVATRHSATSLFYFPGTQVGGPTCTATAV